MTKIHPHYSLVKKSRNWLRRIIPEKPVFYVFTMKKAERFLSPPYAIIILFSVPRSRRQAARTVPAPFDRYR